MSHDFAIIQLVLEVQGMGKAKFRTRMKSEFLTIGSLVERYKKIYIIILGVISAFEIAMMIRGFLVFDFSRPKHITYTISYSVLLLISLVCIFVVAKTKSARFLSYLLHFYSFAILVWSVVISSLDMSVGNFPIVYLTVLVMIGGLVVINPYFYTAIASLSLFTIFVVQLVCDIGWYARGEFINIIVFFIMSLIMAYRHYSVSLNENKVQRYLEELSHTDLATGLGNETAYYKLVDVLDKKIENSIKTEFAVIVMDVNGVKYVDDTYGHRYGNHLICTAGKMLPSLFTTSSLFHIGGDEFVAIVFSNDYDNINTVMENINNSLSYAHEELDGQELILSVASGFAVYEEGMLYKDVFQKADIAMYKNKKEMKKELNIQSRKELE